MTVGPPPSPLRRERRGLALARSVRAAAIIARVRDRPTGLPDEVLGCRVVLVPPGSSLRRLLEADDA